MKGLVELKLGAMTQNGEFWLEPDDLKKIVVVVRDYEDNTLFERTYDPQDVILDESETDGDPDDESAEWYNLLLYVPFPSGFSYRGHLRYEIGFVPVSGPAWFEVVE